MPDADTLVADLLEDLIPAAPIVAEPARIIVESRGPSIKVLKDNRVELDDAERKKVMRAGAVWHKGHDGKPSPAVWKSDVRGKIWYVCSTHRCYRCRKSLQASIRDFKYIETTA